MTKLYPLHLPPPPSQARRLGADSRGAWLKLDATGAASWGRGLNYAIFRRGGQRSTLQQYLDIFELNLYLVFEVLQTGSLIF